MWTSRAAPPPLWQGRGNAVEILSRCCLHNFIWFWPRTCIARNFPDNIAAVTFRVYGIELTAVNFKRAPYKILRDRSSTFDDRTFTGYKR